MADTIETVKQGKRHALLRNLTAFYQLVVEVRDRPPEIDNNIGVMFGWSGVGKTESCVYAQNKTRGIRVEIKDPWTRKNFLESILLECQIQPPKRASAADLFTLACEALSEDPRRPLFIDEADIALDKGYGETLRAVAMTSGVPVLLIGEEMLPQKLARIERFDNRVLAWYGAQRCDADDTRMLAEMHLPKLPIAEPVLAEINRKCDGRARRIVAALVGLKQHALKHSLSSIEAGFSVDQVYSGARPMPRLGKGRASA